MSILKKSLMVILTFMAILTSSITVVSCGSDAASTTITVKGAGE